MSFSTLIKRDTNRILIRDIIEEIVMAIQSSGGIDTWLDNGDDTFTITTNGDDMMGGLGVGTKVVLIYSDTTLNKDVVIIELTSNTFTFSSANTTEPDSWKMAIYFDVGSRTEIVHKYNTRSKLNNSKVQKFPLFWLYTDFEQEAGNGEYIGFETILRAALVDQSDATSYEEDRITNKFIPVLYPYIEMIETAFNIAPYKRNFVTTYGEDKNIKFNKYDRTFFGSADKKKSVLPVITDAIEIEIDLKWMIGTCECQI